MNYRQEFDRIALTERSPLAGYINPFLDIRASTPITPVGTIWDPLSRVPPPVGVGIGPRGVELVIGAYLGGGTYGAVYRGTLTLNPVDRTQPARAFDVAVKFYQAVNEFVDEAVKLITVSATPYCATYVTCTYGVFRIRLCNRSTLFGVILETMDGDLDSFARRSVGSAQLADWEKLHSIAYASTVVAVGTSTLINYRFYSMDIKPTNYLYKWDASKNVYWIKISDLGLGCISGLSQAALSTMVNRSMESWGTTVTDADIRNLFSCVSNGTPAFTARSLGPAGAPQPNANLLNTNAFFGVCMTIKYMFMLLHKQFRREPLDFLQTIAEARAISPAQVMNIAGMNMPPDIRAGLTAMLQTVDRGIREEGAFFDNLIRDLCALLQTFTANGYGVGRWVI